METAGKHLPHSDTSFGKTDVFISCIWCCGLVLCTDSECTMWPPAGECVKYHDSVDEKGHILRVLRNLWPGHCTGKCRNAGAWQESTVLWAMLHSLMGHAQTAWDTVPNENFSCIECEGNVADSVWSRYCCNSAHGFSLWLYPQYPGGLCQKCLNDQIGWISWHFCEDLNYGSTGTMTSTDAPTMF